MTSAFGAWATAQATPSHADTLTRRSDRAALPFYGGPLALLCQCPCQRRPSSRKDTMSGTVSASSPLHRAESRCNPGSRDTDKRARLCAFCRRQVLTSSAQRLPGDAGIFEQGAGELDLVRAAEALMENTPRVTLLPAVLNLTDCPYMWPFCEQPLYATAQPLVLNVTVLNGLGVRGHVVGPPQWRLLSGPDVLDVRVAFADTLWPWTGHLALSVSVREDVPAPADVSGSLTLTVRSQVPPRARKAGAADYVEGSATLPVHVRVVPAPAREKRVLWDQFHNLQYPPGYVPRDNLDRKRDLLDCHGDHLHTNFREVRRHRQGH